MSIEVRAVKLAPGGYGVEVKAPSDAALDSFLSALERRPNILSRHLESGGTAIAILGKPKEAKPC